MFFINYGKEVGDEVFLIGSDPRVCLEGKYEAGRDEVNEPRRNSEFCHTSISPLLSPWLRGVERVIGPS